jgi:hypothetical protein
MGSRPEAKARWREEPLEVELHGERAEFRTALREEINAARRSAAGSGVPVINGRRIAQIGHAFQYAFLIQNAINAPGDQPADLHVPGRAPVEATVISVEGLAVTISVTEDLGATVAYATLRSDLTLLLRRLISRIEDLADTGNPAGDRLLGQTLPTGVPTPEHVAGLNPEQAKAVASSLGRDTTFIWGPPGTGKTRTIGTIGERLYRRDRSLLLVSHTNAAVDQALLHIARQLGGEMVEGSVLRIGEPVDQRLKEQPELLAVTHIKRRTEELQKRRDLLEAENRTRTARVIELARLIAMLEWLPEGTRDIQETRVAVAELRKSELATEAAGIDLAGLRDALPALDEATGAATQALGARAEHIVLADRIPLLAEEEVRAAAAADEARSRLEIELDALDQSERLEPLRREAEGLPAPDVQRDTAARLRAAEQAASESAETARTELADAEGVMVRAEKASALQRRWRGLPKPEDQEPIVAQRRRAFTRLEQASATACGEADAAQAILGRVDELATLLEPWRSLRRLAQQMAIRTDARRAAEAAATAAASAVGAVVEARGRLDELASALVTFTDRYGHDPDEIMREADEHRERLGDAERDFADRTRADVSTRDNLRSTVSHWLDALRSWGLEIDEARGDVLEMLDALERARDHLAAQAAGHDIEELRRERDSVNSEIHRASAEVAEIDELLKTVEATLVAEARVIATTLTRAYTRETVHARLYDTVVLDEASMAPIPALWAAAALAECNVILVGDFKQLPPIKHSDHELAERWLGRDVFEASGVLKAYEAGTPPPHFVQLNEQFRMHPNISAISNELIYDSTLRDGRGTDDDSALDDFYRRDWGHDAPVLMVDTESTNAWVTSVERSGRGSRMNFLSATICLDLAVRMLRDDRPTARPGDQPRILIASPYRPQARLLEIMIREQNLRDEILAGTAHTFQGSEAPIVIFDLVVDEPHWRVALFAPPFDDTSRRLLNVALTRAQRRLVIVGDFAYARKNGKRAFLNRLLAFTLDRYACVEAVDIVPVGLAARAAQSHTSVFGGGVEPDADRMVMTQEDFGLYFPGDLAAAIGRVIIYSPFVTSRRLAVLETHLKALVERGVRVYVVTKAREDRGKRESDEYRRLEKALTAWGIRVIHKPKMHEKLMFIDDHIVWAGSLNPLSFSDSREVMTRYDSRAVVEDYAGAMALDKILALYEAGEGSCPVCGSELVPAEGRAGVYWKCVVPGCHTRSLDSPTPKDGKIVCHACGEAVEFVELPSGPHWRCREEKRHRQQVILNHLKLPLMEEEVHKAVGKAGLIELETQLAAFRKGQDTASQLGIAPSAASDDQPPLFS